MVRFQTPINCLESRMPDNPKPFAHVSITLQNIHFSGQQQTLNQRDRVYVSKSSTSKMYHDETPNLSSNLDVNLPTTPRSGFLLQLNCLESPTPDNLKPLCPNVHLSKTSNLSGHQHSPILFNLIVFVCPTRPTPPILKYCRDALMRVPQICQCS